MVIFGIYREVSPQESLKEAALSTAAVPEHIAAEHAALRLLLLQVDLLVSGHCSVDTKIHQVLTAAANHTWLQSLDKIGQQKGASKL